jgi:hypothetical protein
MVDLAATPQQDPHSRAAAPRPPTTFAAAAITVVGALVLLDLGFETFRSGSTLRWWSVGAAAAYLLTAAATFRRPIGWRIRLAMLFTVFLGVLALTTWMPGGLTDGLRAFGQPTARLLSAVSAAALVGAFLVLIQATALPLPLRLGAALIALYGAGAFALASWQLTPYGAVFNGGSEWHALPRVLQGAVVGGLLALPAALIVVVFGGLSRGARNWRPDAIVALALTLVMVVSGFLSAAGSSQSVAMQVNGAAVAPSSAAEVIDAPMPPDARTGADAVALVKQVASVTPPATFDVDRKATEIGNDPAALFAYVHDHVRTEIYSGVLRGARSTLMGGAGNAWDQSLLLAAMLRHHGREARFARAHLAQDAAAKIVDRMFADAERPRQATLAAPQIPGSIQAVGRKTLARIQANSSRSRAELLNAMDRAHLALGDSAVSMQQLQSEAADHVFVEYRDGEQWTALDPVGASSPGASIAPAGETFAAIPEASHHHVTIRVMVEERRDQKLATKPVLTYTATADAIDGSRVALFNNVDHDVTGRWRAMPILMVDGVAYGALRFTDAGVESVSTKKDADLIGQAHSAVGELGRVTDVFSSDDAAQQKPAAGAQLSAVWIEFAFADPSSREDVARRPILDRIGFAARADHRGASAQLAPMSDVNGVPVAIAGVYGCSLTSGGMDPSWPTRQISPEANGDPNAPRALLNELWSAAASVQVASQLLGRTGGGPLVFYEATPRLAIASLTFTARKDNGGAVPAFSVDLRRNPVRVVGRHASARDLVAANLSRGVLDGAIEDAAAAIAGASTAVISTTAVMASATRTRSQMVATRDASAVTPLPITDEARARLSDAVREGRVVVLPTQPMRAAGAERMAWWEVDLASGETVGVLDNGLRGAQPLGEQATVQVQVDLPFARTMAALPPPPIPAGYTLSAADLLGIGFGFGVVVATATFLAIALIGGSKSK